jgi:hypothetical protein
MRPDGMYVWDATWLFMQCGIVRVANAAGVVTRYKRATAVTIQRVATGQTRHSRTHPCRVYTHYIVDNK